MKKSSFLLLPVLSLLLLSSSLLTGCGSSSPAKDFSLAVAPATVNVANGGPAASLTIAATALNGFKGTVSVVISGLPTGVTATPSTVSVTPGTLQQIALTASGAPVGPVNVTLTGTSGTTTHTATASVSVAAGMASAALTNSTYDFGNDLVGNTLTQSVVTVENTGGADLTLAPTITGDASYSLASSQSCGATLAAGASCAVSVNYLPTAASGATPQTATLNLGFSNVASGTPETVALTGVSAALGAGVVTATNNPQVAQYTVTLPFPGAVTINFGTDTTYGLTTWSQSTATAGPVTILVAGMLAATTYHMQASVVLANGITTTDVDHAFTTGASPKIPVLTATTTAGLTPQAGVEQLDSINGNLLGVAVTDLQGRVIWTYTMPNDVGGYTVEAAKLLSNGHYLLQIGQGSSFVLTGAPTPPNVVVAIREVDLAGNIIKEITVADLTHELQAAGYNLTLQQFHHEVTPLANGHWLVLSNTLVPFNNLPGYPGVTNVLGDVVIDLDTNLQPVWVWNEFDHLDVNRHPFMFPDWTHTNAIVYSPDDGNIFVSMRHQNWVVKVDYNNGAGAGDILWHLGEGGDFTLKNGVDPTDWEYAQHYPHLFSAASAGVFSLGMMDNGDDRIFPTGVVCGTTGNPPCLYTTIPVYQIDETAKTATLTFHQILPTSLYSFFGGNAELMDNGNIEYDLAGVTTNSDIYEVTPTATPQTVWHLHSQGTNIYRGVRIPSLYPGVQW